MKSKAQSQSYLKRILHDEKLQMEWEKSHKNKAPQNNSSEQQTDYNELETKVLQKFSKLTSKNSNVSNPQTDKINEINQKLQKKTIELEEFKTQAAQIVDENYTLKKNLYEVGLVLKDIHQFLLTKLHKTGHQKQIVEFQNCINKPAQAMKQLKKLLTKFGQGQWQEVQIKQKLQKAIEQNNTLNKVNQRLLTHIQQRKVYSQSLKQKILKLKQQIKTLQNSNEGKQEVKKQLQKFQQKLDLKYVNRNDLILILKNLIQKIIKHNRQASISENKINLDDLQKYNIKEFSKRSRSKNGSRDKYSN